MRVTYFNLRRKKERFKEIIEGENNYKHVVTKKRKQNKHCPLQGGHFSKTKTVLF